MHPFELPDFYMPYVARLNPHLERARVHSKAWAYTMGILAPEGSEGPVVWDERTFDVMDFALFSAQTHPDAPPQELDTLTDWFIWGWFVDDYFPVAYGEGADLTAAREYLSRLLSFMPEDLSAATPEPRNPAENAIADLWPRTAPVMSPAWRRRCVENVRIMAEASIREVFNLQQDAKRILDPIEFIALRRKICGMAWAADLLEFSLSLELPPNLYATRPIRVINDVFADAGGLRNDILSYHHDAAKGTPNNGVMVVQAFLGCDLQRAVDVVDDLVSSRMFQLENTVAVELPDLFEEHAVDPATRWKVLRYLRGVQDWMAGEFKWCMRPGGRYLPAKPGSAEAPAQTSIVQLLGNPTGLGTATIRLTLPNIAPSLKRFKSNTHVRFKPVGPLTPPEFYMPYPVRVSPHLAEAREHCAGWCRAMGMLEELPGVQAGYIWNEHTFDVTDPAFCGALVYPDDSPAELELSVCWLAWMIYADDYFPMIYGRTRDRAGAKRFHERLALFMPLDASVLPGDVPQNPVERGLLDLWLRTAGPLPLHARRRFHEAVRDMTESWLWELDNQLEHRIPDPIDYIEMRRRTFGWDLAFSLSRLSIGEEPRPDIVTLLEAAMSDVGSLMNDIFSFQKEIEFHGELHNAVLIVQRFLDLDQAQALVVTRDLVTARIRQFEHMAAIELPAILDDLGTSEESRTKIGAYVEWMQQAMAGLLRWNTVTGRYQEAELVASEWPEKRFAHALAEAGTSLGLATPPALLSALRVDRPSMLLNLVRERRV